MAMVASIMVTALMPNAILLREKWRREGFILALSPVNLNVVKKIEIHINNLGKSNFIPLKIKNMKFHLRFIIRSNTVGGCFG